MLAILQASLLWGEYLIRWTTVEVRSWLRDRVHTTILILYFNEIRQQTIYIREQTMRVLSTVSDIS